MKTRQLHTRFWQDEFVLNSPIDVKLLYVYLLTCPYIGLTGIFRISKPHVALETGLTLDNVNEALKDLENAEKVFAKGDWVYIPRTEEFNSFAKSPKTGVAYKKELRSLPKDIVEYFDKKCKIDTLSIGYQYPTDTLTSNSNSNRGIVKGGKDFRTIRKELRGKGIPVKIGAILAVFLISLLVFPKTALAKAIRVTYIITIKSEDRGSTANAHTKLYKSRTPHPHTPASPPLASKKTQTERPKIAPRTSEKSVDVSTLTETQTNVLELIKRYFGEEWKLAYAVARSESGLRCDAVGDTSLTPSSYGVFQIRAFPGRPPVEDLLDCEKNIEYAAKLRQWGGWGHWSVYNSGRYLVFMN